MSDCGLQRDAILVSDHQVCTATAAESSYHEVALAEMYQQPRRQHASDAARICMHRVGSIPTVALNALSASFDAWFGYLAERICRIMVPPLAAQRVYLRAEGEAPSCLGAPASCRAGAVDAAPAHDVVPYASERDVGEGGRGVDSIVRYLSPASQLVADRVCAERF